MDELCDFLLAQNGGPMTRLLGIGSLGDAPSFVERLDVEEAQSG